MLLFANDDTRPAPFDDTALLRAHTDTRASCGREKASAMHSRHEVEHEL
jgi:hypothetical protein